MQPLHVLVFLAPLLAAYEIGSWVYLRDPDSGFTQSVVAYRLLADVMARLGVIGAALPTILIAGLLVAWHLRRRDRWTVKPLVIAGMAGESLVWTLPLFVLTTVVGSAGVGFAQTGDDLVTWPWQSRLTLAIGAGLYEELLFRLLIIGGGGWLIGTALGWNESRSGLAATVISAVLFSAYHRPILEGGGLDWGAAFIYLLAGGFFGLLYAMRGFGVVVGAHAAYDAIVLLWTSRGG